MINMVKETIKQITKEWNQLIHRALDSNRIPSLEIRGLFRRTYEVLYYFHKDELIPKIVSEMILEMDRFLYFVTLIADKEFDDDLSLYQAADAIANALKNGFFDGNYECEYPFLKVIDAEGKNCVLDLENGYVEDLI
jgi:hypothetical protein